MPIFYKAILCLLFFIIPLNFLFFRSSQPTQAHILGVAQHEITPDTSAQNSDNNVDPTNIPTPTIMLEHAQTQITITPTAIPTTTRSLPITPNISKKKIYTIVVFGDSFVDTMGDSLDLLRSALTHKYPEIAFNLYNYGIGAQNVSEGLDRFCQAYNYKNRHYPSVCELKPDIIILGSFSYNPFVPYDRDKHWLTLSTLINEAKKVSSQVYLLAEIAPLKNTFGQGKNGVNWDTNIASVHADHIVQQLENTIGLSQTLHVPLIDAFSATQINANKEGDKKYINQNDGIHPSLLGHELMANLIAQTIKIE